MEELAPAPVPALETLSQGIQVAAEHDLIRFHSGPFEGDHRWADYTAFIEPTLAPWERQRIYRLWVALLAPNYYVPLGANATMGSGNGSAHAFITARTYSAPQLPKTP